MRKFLTVLACVGMLISTALAEGELKTEVKPKVFHNTNIYKTNIHRPSGLTSEEIDHILSETSLKGYGKIFREMEDKYNANAVFAISIASIEGGIESGRVDNKNNYFGLMFRGGKIFYKNIADNIMAFGELMNNSTFIDKQFIAFSKSYCPLHDAKWRDLVFVKFSGFMKKLENYTKEEYETVDLLESTQYNDLMISLKLESSELSWGELWKK